MIMQLTVLLEVLDVDLHQGKAQKRKKHNKMIILYFNRKFMRNQNRQSQKIKKIITIKIWITHTKMNLLLTKTLEMTKHTNNITYIKIHKRLNNKKKLKIKKKKKNFQKWKILPTLKFSFLISISIRKYKNIKIRSKSKIKRKNSQNNRLEKTPNKITKKMIFNRRL